jgi:hypothetical protein
VPPAAAGVGNVKLESVALAGVVTTHAADVLVRVIVTGKFPVTPAEVLTVTCNVV